MRQIVLDTETTGLQITEGHRIIEIGCIELINRRMTGNRFHHYINPQRNIENEALAVHGISDQFLLDKPVFTDIAQEFVDFISGAELIIHNAEFDVGFINHELNLTKKKWQPLAKYCHIVDSLAIARQLHVGQRNSLDALCKRYGIDNSNRDLHGALLDATLLAQVYLAMTGGQSSLFDYMVSETVEANSNVDIYTAKTQHNLIIQYADENELLAHQNYLNKMAKKGKCVWLELIEEKQ